MVKLSRPRNYPRAQYLFTDMWPESVLFGILAITKAMHLNSVNGKLKQICSHRQKKLIIYVVIVCIAEIPCVFVL